MRILVQKEGRSTTYNTSEMSYLQETHSVDRVIDRMHKNHTIDEIADATNIVFHGKVTRDYVCNRVNKLIPSYKEKLEELRKLPVIEQRTLEWYETRKTLITASDFAQALGEGKFGTQKQFYQKKCGYVVDKFDPYVPPLKWGCMFEQLASDIYAKRNNTRVHEFGLIKHPHQSFFGASPDGITDEGIMLEIKCPYARKIVPGDIPLQYYYQVQGQLDVCDLDECDYTECAFDVVDINGLRGPDDNTYKNVWNAYDNEIMENGAIVEYSPGEDGHPRYAYSDIDMQSQDLRVWIDHQTSVATTSLGKNMFVVAIHLWKLRQYNVLRVSRDKEFVDTKLDELSKVWENVLRYKVDKGSYEREAAPVSRNSTKKKVTAGPNHDSDEYSFKSLYKS